MKIPLKLDLAKLDPRMLALRQFVVQKRKALNRVLGLAFDAGKLEGVVARRANGGLDFRSWFVTTLSLDPLTDDPVLVGREIRKKLDAAQVRERSCAVCIPLSWVLTLTVKLPELPEPDLQSLLQIEAERGFPYSHESLVIAQSRYRTPAGEPYALLVAVPRAHVNRLQAVLAAAQLHPVSFSLGISALQQADAQTGEVVLTLLPTASNINLQVSCNGEVAVLRTIEGAAEAESSQGRFQPDDVLREIRMTLGQLQPDLQEAVRLTRILGQDDYADELAENLGPALAPLGIKVQQVKRLQPDAFGLPLLSDTPVSPAGGLAVRVLTGQKPGLEFLPPRVSSWQRFAERYSTGKLARAAVAFGTIGLVAGLAFLVQQGQILYWETKWNNMKTTVAELDQMQRQIKKFRPWFDDSYKSLNVLRRLTEAFPEDGTVSAKSVELRHPATVTCSGTARDSAALLRTLEKLRATREVANVHLEQTRGGSPVQFTFNFQWIDRSTQ